MREVAPTRSAAMALADERQLMRQGYNFLDEKRVLLAGEMLRQLRGYQAREADLGAALREASRALAEAVERHGLDTLQVRAPAPSVQPAAPERSVLLGLAMFSAREHAPAASVADLSPEIEACRQAFARVVTLSADVAWRAGNLTRLMHEYKRTERRARALENVLLPEVEEALKAVGEQLDAGDREEVIRARWASRAEGWGVTTARQPR